MTTAFIAFILSFVVLFLVYALMVLGLNLQWGQAGILNFGLVGFAALGAYLTAILMFDPATSLEITVGFKLPFPAAFVIAIIITGIIAWLVSFVVRLGLEELAIITLAFAEVLHTAITNEAWLTGATKGIFIPSLLDEELGLLGYNAAFAGILVVAVLFAYYLNQRLTFTQFGRVLNAIRQDEIKAKSLGFNTVSYRMKAFVIGCMIMAAAGSLNLYFGLRALPELYAVDVTFAVWMGLILGGSGNNLGAILGMAIYIGLDVLARLYLIIPGHPEIAAGLKFVIIGLVLVVVIVRRPEGILGPKRSRYG